MAFKVHLPRTRVNRGMLSVITRNASLFALLFLSLKVAQYMLASARGYWNSLPAPTFRESESSLSGELPRFMHTLTLGEDPFPLSITRRMNKNWTLKEYDIKRGREYVSRHCREHVEAFDVLKPTAFKADLLRLLRYCILFTEGGIWIDDDIVLTQSIDTMTRDIIRVFPRSASGYEIGNDVSNSVRSVHEHVEHSPGDARVCEPSNLFALGASGF